MPDSFLDKTARRAQRYLEDLSERKVFPDEEALNNLEQFAFSLPEDPTSPEKIIGFLDEFGSPATVANAGSRYFGFVTGGTLPTALAANWLAGAWDQNSALAVMSPVAAQLEKIVSGWILDRLQLPQSAGLGFVTGATMANFSGLAAARQALLWRRGWNVSAQGLYGAPEIKVVTGEEVHVSLLKALAMLGLGSQRIIRVPVDNQGRMIADAIPALDDQTILCLQAGNVNTGAFDPFPEICPKANAAGAWVHIDGAFGLWAAASPRYAHLMHGASAADSWATDLHKWLNVPYDSGLVICKEPKHLGAAMTFNAAYLHHTADREPCHFTPEMSKKARAIEAWAALYSLGKNGLAEMVDRCNRHARRFAQGLQEAGFEVLNDVVLNQVLVSFGSAEKTKKAIRAIQAEGTCWCGSTTWQGQYAMRISVSSWATTEEDVEQCLKAMIGIGKNTPF